MYAEEQQEIKIFTAPSPLEEMREAARRMSELVRTCGYRYGEIAYIGGGFGVGIHNTLEAAVYGIPVIFGPKYQKFQEAIQLLETKGAFSVKDYEELKTLLDRMLTDEVFLRESGMNASNYVTSNAGATDKIMSMINF